MSKESVIKVFENVNIRIVWDEELEEYFFAIADIVEVLTESKDVKQYIKRMRQRDPELNSSWGTICTPTRMRAADGKYYKTQAATMKGILRIVQSIPSRKAEPLKQWMDRNENENENENEKWRRRETSEIIKFGRMRSSIARRYTSRPTRCRGLRRKVSATSYSVQQSVSVAI